MPVTRITLCLPGLDRWVDSGSAVTEVECYDLRRGSIFVAQHGSQIEISGCSYLYGVVFGSENESSPVKLK